MLRQCTVTHEHKAPSALAVVHVLVTRGRGSSNTQHCSWLLSSLRGTQQKLPLSDTLTQASNAQKTEGTQILAQDRDSHAAHLHVKIAIPQEDPAPPPFSPRLHSGDASMLCLSDPSAREDGSEICKKIGAPRSTEHASVQSFARPWQKGRTPQLAFHFLFSYLCVFWLRSTSSLRGPRRLRRPSVKLDRSR